MTSPWTSGKRSLSLGQAFQQNGWVGGPIIQALTAHLKTLQDEPPIREGTPDPYVPKQGAEERPDVGVEESQGTPH